MVKVITDASHTQSTGRLCVAWYAVMIIVITIIIIMMTVIILI